jgi:hypothetical protein
MPADSIICRKGKKELNKASEGFRLQNVIRGAPPVLKERLKKPLRALRASIIRHQRKELTLSAHSQKRERRKV